ncbi:unnamed protein product [Nezara viridula]|uniref:Neuropeptide n=1 Tax=Nezara viridula TaxID=85310 RepID=A0A9P0H8M3_NEZVI|nr:unnamed protein product [Nezara viridula]
MALWFRLAILCFCLASTLAAATKEVADDPTSPPKPEPPAPACTEGERQGDATDCHKFTYCKEGKWNQDRCFWFRKYDSVTKKCVMWGATCTTK